GWTVPPERGTSEAEGVSALDGKIHNIINIVPCGEETPSPYGYSPFQVGESIQHKQSGGKASTIHYSLLIIH
ncbi:MAG: hypothetical protein IJ557_09965, partial [Bacteroidaceae bacterium]|nr:hypothetical protein [Bacteroidaceae bacterium]